MKQELIKLKNMRQQEEQLTELLKTVKAKFEEENKDLFIRIAANREEMTSVEMNIKEDALEIYRKDGNKQLPYGVGIKVLKRYNYNEDEALEWAKEHKMALRLDKKAFETLSKTESTKPGFVAVLEVPTATIPGTIEIKDEQEVLQ